MGDWKMILTRLCYCKWKASWKYCQIQSWGNLCTFLLITNHSFKWHKKWLCSNTLKSNKLKIYISLKGNKLACFANSSGALQVQDLVHDVHVSSWCTRGSRRGFDKAHTKVVHQNLNYLHVYQWFSEIWTFIFLQKAEIFKHSWTKIMQLLWTVVIYLLKKLWTWDWTWLDIAYGVCIH